MGKQGRNKLRTAGSKALQNLHSCLHLHREPTLSPFKYRTPEKKTPIFFKNSLNAISGNSSQKSCQPQNSAQWFAGCNASRSNSNEYPAPLLNTNPSCARRFYKFRCILTRTITNNFSGGRINILSIYM